MTAVQPVPKQERRESLTEHQRTEEEMMKEWKIFGGIYSEATGGVSICSLLHDW